MDITAQRSTLPDGMGGRVRLLAALLYGTGLLCLLLITLIHITQGQANLDYRTVFEAILFPDGSLAHNIVRELRLPRTAIGIIAGSGLGIAGLLLQTVTRNPLASPATLGVNAGAYLALVMTAIFFPAIFAFSPLFVAFAGGLLAALLVYGLAAAASVTPVRLALAGVAVSLALSAATATLQIFYEEQTAGLFFWGAGTLAQIDWSGPQYALLPLLLGTAVALVLGRRLEILLLGDDAARSLGLSVERTRLAGTLIGVFLAAVAVSAVGPIGFIGLVAPHLMRLAGLRQQRLLVPAVAIWGAVILVGADFVARLVATNVNNLPTGAVTALVGAPWLIWLARGSARGTALRAHARPAPHARTARRQLPYPLIFALAVLLLVVALLGGILLGNLQLSPGQVAEVLGGNGSDLTRRVLFDLRLPRLFVAMLVGASLAVSGLLVQGVTRNPLAGPGIIGITSGAGVGALIILILFPTLPVQMIPLAAFAGAVAAFGLVYVAAWDRGIHPERLALVGIAVSAFCTAAIQLFVVMARLRVAQALVWLSGSTYARGWDELARLAGWPLLLLPLAWLVAPYLDLLALGDDSSRALGLRLERTRLLLLAVAVALAAAAVSTVGTISFVGLIAPHAARLLSGGRHRKLLPVTALLGATLVVAADTIGRVVLAPKEIPSGLVTALLGAPFFLYLLYQGRAREHH